MATNSDNGGYNTSVLHPSMQARNAASARGGAAHKGGASSHKKLMTSSGLAPGAGASWYGSATKSFTLSSLVDDEVKSKVAMRLLVTIVVCGLIGSFLPVFAVRAALGSDAALAKSGEVVVGGGGDDVFVLNGDGDDGGISRPSLLGGDGSKNLLGSNLKPCSSPDQGTQTGWTRDGSCAWDPSDAGYHEVCVKMDQKFLEASAEKDGNDLSSMVSHGEHWCICAWAWAAAVQRDPKSYEGLTLQCDESNEKLRDVYQSFIDDSQPMSGPTGRGVGYIRITLNTFSPQLSSKSASREWTALLAGISYEADGALKAVNKLCPAAAGADADMGTRKREAEAHKREARRGGQATVGLV